MEKKWTICGVRIIYDSEKEQYRTRMEKDGKVVEVTSISGDLYVTQSPIIGINHDLDWITSDPEQADCEHLKFFVEKMVEIQGVAPEPMRTELYSALWRIIDPHYPR